jgi:hypothetical protein
MTSIQPTNLHAELAALMAEAERLRMALDNVCSRIRFVVATLSEQRRRGGRG